MASRKIRRGKENLQRKTCKKAACKKSDFQSEKAVNAFALTAFS
jgi:hypothetical protein